jgi:hypothetical protein
MKLVEQVTRHLESVVLAAFMVWTVGLAVALLTPQAPERQGVVEIYALTPVADANTGA